MFITGVVPSAIFFLLLLRAPETPRYLFLAGREREGLAILERIAGRRQRPCRRPPKSAPAWPSHRHAWADLLRPGIRRAVVVGFVLAILVHVSGINTIIDYAPAILRSAGWKLDAALFSTFVVGLNNLAFTLLSFWMIDRFGRKPLYIVGSLGMAAALTLLAATVAAGRFQGALVLVLILGYLGFFSSCIGPVFWTLISEIFPEPDPRHRHGRSRAHAMDRQRRGRALLPVRVQPDRQGRDIRISGRHGLRAGRRHLAVGSGNQKQNPRGN